MRLVFSTLCILLHPFVILSSLEFIRYTPNKTQLHYPSIVFINFFFSNLISTSYLMHFIRRMYTTIAFTTIFARPSPPFICTHRHSTHTTFLYAPFYYDSPIFPLFTSSSCVFFINLYVSVSMSPLYVYFHAWQYIFTSSLVLVVGDAQSTV